QAQGEVEVSGHEDGLGNAQVLDREVEEVLQLLVAILGELEAARYLLADLLAQALLDDVARVFEVDGIVHHGERAAQVLAFEALAAELREVDLDLLLEVVDPFLHRLYLGKRREVVVPERIFHAAQHAFDETADATDLAGGVRGSDDGSGLCLPLQDPRSGTRSFR